MRDDRLPRQDRAVSHLLGSVGSLMLALALAGCASLSTAPVGAVPCLPAGVSPAFFGWPVLGAAPTQVPEEDGSRSPGLVVRFGTDRGSSVSVLWTRHGLASVDPKPETDDPPYLDRGLVTPNGRLRSHPTTRCQWQQETPRTTAERSL